MKLLTLAAILRFAAAASNATVAVAAALTGAPELLAHAAHIGNDHSTLLTLLFVALFSISGLYELSASGRIAPLPMLQPIIYGITGLYLARGLFLLPQLLGYNIFSDQYEVVTSDLMLSAVVLVIGIVHLIGLQPRRA